MNCAPVVDVNNNAANPVIHDRSFGDDPDLVGKLAAAYANGLQDAGVIACIKHYPGHGDTAVDSHLESPYIKHDRERLNAVELVPFKKLIDEGAGAVMMAHLVVPALDVTNKLSSMSYSMVTHELKNNLGFTGLVVTDGLGMEAVTQLHQPGDFELEAFLAGNDILLCPLDVPGAIARIEQAIHDGLVSQKDLDNRVLKILQAKAWVRDQQKERNKDITDVHSFLTRPEAYTLQKKLYRNAITVVKDANILPLHKDAIAASCMIQIGTMPENALSAAWAKVGGTVHTCMAALSDTAMNTCLTASERVKTVIIGVGEMNKFVTQKYGIADNTRALVTQLKRMGKKVVVILFGTPYSVSYFKDADTIIVAYEDVAVAQEVAVDVVLGTLHAPGTLPVTVSL
jgi:Beta-glucosidase-related glycosidases